MGKLLRYELMTASCSGRTLTVTQRWGVDGSVGAREWEWDNIDRRRESRKEIPCLLTPTPFSLAVFWLPVFCISCCSSETPASSEWRHDFLTVSLLGERSFLSGFLFNFFVCFLSGYNRERPPHLFNQMPFYFLWIWALMVEACWFELVWTVRRLFQLWSSWNHHFLALLMLDVISLELQGFFLWIRGGSLM